MKFTQYFLYVFVLLFTINGCKQKSKGTRNSEENAATKMLASDYTIVGYVKGAPQGTKFVLTTLGVDRKPDTAIFKGDHFTFKGATPEPLIGEIYYLDNANNPSSPLKLVIENAFVNIEAHIDSFNKGEVIGGLENTDFGNLKDILNLYWDSIAVVSNKIQEAATRKDTVQAKKAQAEYEQMEFETRNAIQQYAIEHPTSISSAYYILQYYSSNIDVEELDSVYNSFDSSILNSLYVKKIKATLDAAKRTSIGSIAPELNLADENFDTVTIASFKGKYLLIDFWASWCLPCRQENPNIVQAYKKYKNKGFDILSVSLDTDRKQWRRAIQKDKLSWKHVSDLKGMESSVIGLYGISTIPSNFLIDKEGKIVVKNIYGENLHQKLAEYLNK